MRTYPKLVSILAAFVVLGCHDEAPAFLYGEGTILSRSPDAAGVPVQSIVVGMGGGCGPASIGVVATTQVTRSGKSVEASALTVGAYVWVFVATGNMVDCPGTIKASRIQVQ